MFNLLLGFAEDAGTGTGTGTQWWTYVIVGVLFVGLILLMILPQRKQKKQMQEMMSRVQVGCTITTIGGIIGEIVELDDATNTFVLCTGNEDNKQYLKFTRQAIYQVHKSKEELEAQLTQEAKKDSPEEDEIK